MPGGGESDEHTDRDVQKLNPDEGAIIGSAIGGGGGVGASQGCGG